MSQIGKKPTREQQTDEDHQWVFNTARKIVCRHGQLKFNTQLTI